MPSARRTSAMTLALVATVPLVSAQATRLLLTNTRGAITKNTGPAAEQSQFGGSIAEFTIDGVFVKYLVPDDGTLDAPDTLAISPIDDMLCVSTGTFLGNSAVVKFHPRTGVRMGVCAQGGGLIRPYGFAFLPDGAGSYRIFVSSFFTDQILEYDAAGAFVAVLAAGTATPDGVNGPNIIAVGPDAALYVTTQGSVAVAVPTDSEDFATASPNFGAFPGLTNQSQVLKVSPATGSFAVFAAPPVIPEFGFVSLLGIGFLPGCFGGGGGPCRLVTTDFANGIRRYKLDGKPVGGVDATNISAPFNNFIGSLSIPGNGFYYSCGFLTAAGNQGFILRYQATSGQARPAPGLAPPLLTAPTSMLNRSVGILAL